MDGLFRLVEEPDAKQVAKKEKIATKYYEKPDSIEEISPSLPRKPTYLWVGGIGKPSNIDLFFQ